MFQLAIRAYDKSKFGPLSEKGRGPTYLDPTILYSLSRMHARAGTIGGKTVNHERVSRQAPNPHPLNDQCIFRITSIMHPEAKISAEIMHFFEKSDFCLQACISKDSTFYTLDS